MKAILSSLLVLLFALPSQARLGETLKELKRRYGQPINAENAKETHTTHYSFYWEQYVIEVTLEEGRSVSEQYTRQNRRDFSLQEVRLLLEESSPGLAWTQVDGSNWKQQDRVATWTGKALVVQEKQRAR